MAAQVFSVDFKRWLTDHEWSDRRQREMVEFHTERGRKFAEKRNELAMQVILGKAGGKNE
jgi:hypothetical protein